MSASDEQTADSLGGAFWDRMVRFESLHPRVASEQGTQPRRPAATTRMHSEDLRHVRISERERTPLEREVWVTGYNRHSGHEKVISTCAG